MTIIELLKSYGYKNEDLDKSINYINSFNKKNLINENSLSDNTTKKLRDLINKLYEEEKQINDSYSHTIPDIEKLTKIKEGALNVSKSFSDEELNALAYLFLQGLEDKLSNKQLEKYYN